MVILLTDRAGFIFESDLGDVFLKAGSDSWP